MLRTDMLHLRASVVLGTAIVAGCAGAAPKTIHLAPAGSAQGVTSSDEHKMPRTTGVRRVDLRTLEQDDAFPCPDVDRNDPDYIPCVDGGS